MTLVLIMTTGLWSQLKPNKNNLLARNVGEGSRLLGPLTVTIYWTVFGVNIKYDETAPSSPYQPHWAICVIVSAHLTCNQ